MAELDALVAAVSAARVGVCLERARVERLFDLSRISARRHSEHVVEGTRLGEGGALHLPGLATTVVRGRSTSLHVLVVSSDCTR